MWLKDYVCGDAISVNRNWTTDKDPQLTKGKGIPLSFCMNYNRLNSKHKRFALVVDTEHEPKNYQETYRHNRWLNAMSNEIEALENNGAWTITQLPPNKRAVGSKWVYKIKYNADGTME